MTAIIPFTLALDKDGWVIVRRECRNCAGEGKVEERVSGRYHYEQFVESRCSACEGGVETLRGDDVAPAVEDELASLSEPEAWALSTDYSRHIWLEGLIAWYEYALRPWQCPKCRAKFDRFAERGGVCLVDGTALVATEA